MQVVSHFAEETEENCEKLCPDQDTKHSPLDECRVFLLHKSARYLWSCNMGEICFHYEWVFCMGRDKPHLINLIKYCENMESHSAMKPLTHFEEIFEEYLQAFNMSFLPYLTCRCPSDSPVLSKLATPYFSTSCLLTL